jgi:hypothetical protein
MSLFKLAFFPDTMKKTIIRPLFKKGDRQDMQNYRPISILSVLSEILEKFMYNRLLSFLKKHNVLTNMQHGFKDDKSTETANHLFINSVQEALDRHLHVVGIFLDLSKVYSITNHNILLNNLRFLWS